MDVLTASLAVEIISRLLSRRTRPGEGHVVLNEAEVEEQLGRIRSSMPTWNDHELRKLRNQLAHGIVTTIDYDHLLSLAWNRGHGEHRTELVLRLMREWTKLDTATGGLESELWIDAATAVADSFVQHLAAGADALGKIDSAEASRLGRAAAENVLSAARWSQVVGDRIDTTAVTRLLGVSRQALAKRQAAGSLLGLPGNGTTWYPTWQFDLESGEIRPEVRDIIGAFRERLDDLDPLAIASWATTPQDEDLDTLTPEQWLKLGRDAAQLRRAAERAASRLSR